MEVSPHTPWEIGLCVNQEHSSFASNGQQWGRSRKICSPIENSRIATWNVEGMSSASSTKWEELCSHMRQHEISLMCLQETHLFGAEVLEYKGFNFFMSGESVREGRSFSGVGFVVAPWALRAVVSFLAISDQLARLRLKVPGGVLNVLSIYLPHAGHDIEYRRGVMADLSKYTQSDCQHTSTLVLGDFNAQLGYVGVDESERIGPYVYKRNVNAKLGTIQNREILLEYCITNSMMVANTFCNHPEEFLVSYYNLSAKPTDPITAEGFSQIDHILCELNNPNMVRDCWSSRTEMLQSHHFITFVDICVHFERKPRIKKSSINLMALREIEVSANFYRVFNGQIKSNHNAQHSVDEHAASISAAFKMGSKTLPTKESSAKRPWISVETLDLINERGNKRRAGEYDEECRLHKLVRASAKRD